MNNINYFEGKNELFPQILPLRNKLLIHHKNLKHHFVQDFVNKLNNNNIATILADENFKEIKVILAKDINNNKNIGFCLGGVNEKNIGVINSIYVEPEYQKFGIGTELMKKILKWLDDKKVISKELSVCASNEIVFNFYEKFNFLIRKTLLKQIK